MSPCYHALILCLALLVGCGSGEINYEPVDNEECEQTGVCVELSVLMYDRPEGYEFVIDEKGEVVLKKVELLRFSESHCDKNPESKTGVTCWISFIEP